MTMVATPGVIGILQSDAPGSALVMTVDGAYAAYLAGVLVGGAWTYAKSRVGNSVEIIKITGITGQIITVDRAEDNTTALVFATGAELEFVMGASAVADLIAAASMAPAITISGAGAAVVTEPTTNNYIVTVPVTELTSSGGSLVVTSTGENIFNAEVNTSTIGCCASS